MNKIIGKLSACIFLLFFFITAGNVFAAYTYSPKVTFTFDDTSQNIYQKALPIFKEFNLRAVEFPEIALMNNGEDWVMSWDNLIDLQNNQKWEIGSHSINHPDLIAITDAQLEDELLGSKKAFADKGIYTNSFATPFGSYDNRVLKAISKYYLAHRAAWGGPNIFPSIYNDYEIICYEITNRTTPTTVYGWIDSAIANKQWLVFLLHDIVDGTPRQYEYNKDNLRKIVDYVSKKPIQAVTISEGIALTNNPNLAANSSFEEIENDFALGWSHNNNTNVIVDTQTNGNFPLSKNSLKIIGGSSQNELISTGIAVKPSIDYLFKFFVNGTTYSSGNWTSSINEYNSENILLRERKFETISSSFFGVKYFTYTPSSDTSNIKIKFYTTAGSNLTLFFDSVELREFNNNPLPTATNTPMQTNTPTATNTPKPLSTSTPTPTTKPLPTSTATPKPSVSLSPTPTPTVSGVALVLNNSFEEISNNFAVSWSRSNTTAITIDTNSNGCSPNSKNSLFIKAGTTQYTAKGSLISINNSSTYELSFCQKILNYQKGGTACYIGEHDTNGAWLSGKWLGGNYSAINKINKYTYKPSSTRVKQIQIHLFTERNSILNSYFDEVNLIKK